MSAKGGPPYDPEYDIKRRREGRGYLSPFNVDQIADALVERLADRIGGVLLEATDRRPLYTVKSAAERLSVTDRQVREYIADGKLESFKMGGARRIDPREIDRFLLECRAEGDTE